MTWHGERDAAQHSTASIPSKTPMPLEAPAPRWPTDSAVTVSVGCGGTGDNESGPGSCGTWHGNGRCSRCGGTGQARGLGSAGTCGARHRAPTSCHPETNGKGAQAGASSEISAHNEPLCKIVCLPTNHECTGHIPTHEVSGCDSICAITRARSRYMTPEPGKESVYAPSRLLMAHIPTLFGRIGDERPRRDDD